MKNEKLAAFVAKLEQLHATPEMVKKYVSIFGNLQHYRKHQVAQLAQHASHVKVAELHCKHGRIVTTKQLLQRIATGDKIDLLLCPELDLQHNLAGHCGKNDLLNARKLNVQERYRPIGNITVWQEPDANDNPCLTPEQIITQIPHGLVGDTKAVCLLLEERTFFDAYDIYMGCHKYNVWLFG